VTGGYAAEVADVRPGDELDWPKLTAYLQEHIEGLGPLAEVKQFPNGSANLTYRLDFAGRRLVVRRPPFGRIPTGAHDMKREYRALSRLWSSYDRAPRAFLFCDDHEVAGADFLVMEYREGQTVWNEVPANMAHHQDAARRIGLAVVDALADLHGVDPERAGVADLGRPEGFVDRQLSGWRKRWEATSYAYRLPLVGAIADQLRARQPRSPGPAILHNDYKLDNCQFDPADPDRVISVFDWDMATVGDPLIDLGTLLNYWPDPSDEPDNRPMHPIGQENLGLPPRRAVIERYAQRGQADLSAIWWYEAFANWRTAIVVAQLHDRYLAGQSHDARQAEKGARIGPLAQRAAVILEGA
jgi:aminoglycoside phosphotransferase (APT) family kinase protein